MKANEKTIDESQGSFDASEYFQRRSAYNSALVELSKARANFVRLAELYKLAIIDEQLIRYEGRQLCIIAAIHSVDKGKNKKLNSLLNEKNELGQNLIDEFVSKRSPMYHSVIDSLME